MKIKSSKLGLLFIITNLGCTQSADFPGPGIVDLTTSDTTEEFYGFRYDKFIISFSGESNETLLSGEIKLFKDQLEVSNENVREKYFIKSYKKDSWSLILETEDANKETATWQIYESGTGTHIEADIDGMMTEFNITSGQYSEIPLFKTENSKPEEDSSY